jgi:predicted dehydrogenase
MNPVAERLRVGVVGVGYLGSIHARIYARMPEVELVGVVDVDVAARTRAGEECGCPAFASAEELLDRVDAVSIVVPTTLHRAEAQRFIDAGVHVLLEKPVAHTVEDAAVIVEAAERRGVVLQIGHLERFNAGVATLAERLERPRFIEVHRLGTFVERATDVDVVTDLMIHDIDIVLSLIRAELRYVSAVGTRVVTDHVDIANARLEFANGSVANVTASRVSNKRFRRFRVFADSCYMALDYTDQQIEVVRAGPRPDGGGFAAIRTEQIDVRPRPPLDAELEHFVETVRDGGRPLVSGRDGLEALRVAEIVRRRIQESIDASCAGES